MTGLAHVSSWLRCPVCRAALGLAGGRLVCPTGHAFDIARQGYVNLLGRSAPANADTADMVAARERFLSAGHYDPISDAVVAAAPGARRVLDVGAGTGHHLARFLTGHPEARGLAVDVSVPAARRAARAHPRMAAMVADTWAGLPVADGAVDTVLCIFAPRNPAEFARVLSDDGVVVVVVPQVQHLQDLRETHGLLEVGAAKVERLAESAQGHLEVVSRHDIAEDLDLGADEVADLVGMGPNAFHPHAATGAARVHISVSCVVLRKPAAPLVGFRA